MADASVPDFTDQQVRADLINRKTPRQVAGLFQWWAARQGDQRLIRWARHQVIIEMSTVQGYEATAEFLKALMGQ